MEVEEYEVLEQTLKLFESLAAHKYGWNRLATIDSAEAASLVRHAHEPQLHPRKQSQDGATESDVIDCTVFAPATAEDESDFLVQVFVHLFDQVKEVSELAHQFDSGTERRAFKSLETEIARGSKLTFHLSMPKLNVETPTQTLIWRGRPEAAQFVVEIPEGQRVGKKFGTVIVSQDNVPVGQISFSVDVKLRRSASSPKPELKGEATRYKKAFISYSSEDRNEVLKRVQMLAKLHINFFQDLIHLDAGARWEQELYRNIDDSDVFLLFWSSSAKRSKWVMEEVRYALKVKGGNESAPPAIIPIIIEGPPIEPPPDLSHIHFNDYVMYFQTK